jgi:acetylornithine/succinyldiaminopimelate/putrescine aminotransferase
LMRCMPADNCTVGSGLAGGVWAAAAARLVVPSSRPIAKAFESGDHGSSWGAVNGDSRAGMKGRATTLPFLLAPNAMMLA